MSAFVPAPGLSLSSSRVFVSGSNTTLSSKPSRRSEPRIDTEISALKLPALKLPSLPDLLSVFKRGTAPPPPAPKAPDLNIGGQFVKGTGPKKPAAASVTQQNSLAGGLPKFYKPATARAEFIANAKGHNATAMDVRVGREKNTTNRRINEQGTFRNMDPYTDELVWARPGWSSDEARVGVRVALRNVLGNANLFESEIAELAFPISCVTETADMKEFVRAVGLSNAYRKRFFEGTSNTRFVECNFKHFLGRAPYNQEEVSEHIKIIVEQGYNAEINSYIDCDEYDTLFGESRIPAVNFRGGHLYNNSMNKTAILNGSYPSTDRITTKAFLASGDASGFSSFGILKGLPEAWRGENSARSQAGPVMSYDPDVFWNPQPAGLRAAEVAWTSRYGNWSKFWYKDSKIYTDVMKPKLTHTQEEEEEAAAVLKYGANMSKAYIGSRKTFDVAPVIEIRPSSSPDVFNGQLSVKMQEIVFSIPSELQRL